MIHQNTLRGIVAVGLLSVAGTMSLAGTCRASDDSAGSYQTGSSGHCRSACHYNGRSDQARSLGLEQERKEALERCLKALKSELAELVRARLGGDSYTEICGRLGLRPEQAHKLFHQAKAQLKTCVEGALG